MPWLWFFITIAIGAIACALIAWTFVFAFNSDKNFIWTLVGAVMFILAATFSGDYTKSLFEKKKTKQVVVSTSVYPQIDTVITYSKGKQDTLYTFYFVKED